MKTVTTSEIQLYEKEHLAALRAMAPECMVLLKKNGDFPLTSPCKVALYGSGARKTIKGGTGSGDVNVRHTVTVEDGLENAGFTVTTKPWLDAYDEARASGRKAFLDGIKAEAEKLGKPAFLIGMGKTAPEPKYAFELAGEGEICVYVLARNSGEGSDRTASKGDLLLTDDEVRDILLCAEKYPKFLLVLNVGGPVDLSPVLDRVENILLLSQLGSVIGDAFADVLLGKANPSGKLTTTWARAEDYRTNEGFGALDDTRYTEGVFVGYRYFEAAAVKPIFPFGYGLSYTEFAVEADHFSVEDSTVCVRLTVRNTGRFAGKDSVRLYYTAPNGKLTRPVRELGAYAKTDLLQPGEQETLALMLPVEDMAAWDTDRDAWVLEKGAYVILLENKPVGIVELDGEAVTERLSHSGGEADFEDWRPSVEKELPAGIPMLTFEAEGLNGKGHFQRERLAASQPETPELSGLTDEELATICVGRHGDAGGMTAIIGNSAARVAGGAGETADLAEKKGFGKLVTSDGPAGLRLAIKYAETPDGAESLDNVVFDDLLELLSEPIQQLFRARFAKSKELEETYGARYHYASAIPVGTALAQSWNTALVEECGELVGEEMERFGVNVWLAPALNIHRSPLCGRNFEYYSEDPLVSGKVAAAMTRGVQKHAKCAVTIKHFACNNQEFNRMGSNSLVSQRALREIYLKGFEICVKEAAPLSLMTSYNLLNGVHTANRRDLLTTILREEWGFSGFVMTDWGTTGDSFNMGVHGCSSPALCVKAGNDLIMPGEKKDVDGILDGLAQGTISRADLELCAGRILAISQRLS